MKRTFIEAIENRRSYYALDNTEIVPTTKINEILETAIKSVPSAFNSCSTRLILLTGNNHIAFWQMVKDELQKIVPATAFVNTQLKIDTSFASGYGTILFYEDMAVVEGLQKQFPLYSDRFPVWAEHTSAMHQFAIWTMLEDEGLGASLQHYNPLIDPVVAAKFNVPNSWRLIAQMPFGKPIAPAATKESWDYASHIIVK